ncbi:hypothetical protein [Siphonobacter curvatus]|uniref:hypothetical protein n=1 Tax=Siphonobacter curvatus TaxID=2094562 RepID=UPI0010575D37|nr:hypothetical protein [Siphonobacter curvatus]
MYQIDGSKLPRIGGVYYVKRTEMGFVRTELSRRRYAYFLDEVRAPTICNRRRSEHHEQGWIMNRSEFQGCGLPLETGLLYLIFKGGTEESYLTVFTTEIVLTDIRGSRTIPSKSGKTGRPMNKSAKEESFLRDFWKAIFPF